MSSNTDISQNNHNPEVSVPALFQDFPQLGSLSFFWGFTDVEISSLKFPDLSQSVQTIYERKQTLGVQIKLQVRMITFFDLVQREAE